MDENEPKLKKKTIFNKLFVTKYIYLFIIGLALLAGVSYGLTFFIQDKQVATGHLGITIGYINYYDDNTLLHTERVYAGNTNHANYIPSNSSGFLGWATTNGGNVVYETGDAVTFANTTNLYAVYDINLMGFFPSTILNQKVALEEVHFIIDSEEEINAQYNVAFLKADLTYDNRGMVKCWIADNKLYIGATSKIYLYDTYDSTNELGLFEGFSSVTEIDFGNNVNTSMVTTMQDMFGNCSSLTSLDVTTFNTSNVTSMHAMFAGCSSLTSLDVTHFNTSNVTSMYSMFYNCSSLTGLDVSHFNTSNVTTMRSMFNGCGSLINLDLSHFDTSNVESMYYMFLSCGNLQSVDLSSFNTSKVTTMAAMFSQCFELRSLDVSNFDTHLVENMGNMFNGVGQTGGMTSLDVSSFDTSSVESMTNMFRGTRFTSLDLSNFNTASVTNMSGMFRDCTNLVTVYTSGSWSTSAVTTSSDMFTGSTSIVGQNNTTYNSSYVDKTYARWDRAAAVGYFTRSAVIPDTYQKVTYIASDGTAYIDTGYYPTPATRVETEFQFTNTTAQQRLFSIKVNGDLVYTFYINNSINFGYGYFDNGNNGWITLGVAANTNKHNLRFNSDGTKVRFDSSYNSNISGGATATSPNTLLLLAGRDSSGNVDNYGQARIYYFAIYNGSTSAMNLIPCKRKSDNVAGLYDAIGGNFYTAAESGTSLTAGPNI